MTTATMYVEDIDQSAEYFADTEGMNLDAKRTVLDVICDALSQRTGYEIDWDNQYSPNGWIIDGVSHYTSDGAEQVIADELGLAIERIVNDPAYTGPMSL